MKRREQMELHQGAVRAPFACKRRRDIPAFTGSMTAGNTSTFAGYVRPDVLPSRRKKGGFPSSSLIDCNSRTF